LDLKTNDNFFIIASSFLSIKKPSLQRVHPSAARLSSEKPAAFSTLLRRGWLCQGEKLSKEYYFD